MASLAADVSLTLVRKPSTSINHHKSLLDSKDTDLITVLLACQRLKKMSGRRSPLSRRPLIRLRRPRSQTTSRSGSTSFAFSTAG